MGRKDKLYTFYCCYLLRSVDASYAGYVGSTPDPVRRLRQHNGEIKGGARQMVLFVHGFQSPLAALQFEWIWQHPERSRHLRKKAKKTFQGHLETLVTLLQHNDWSRWNLSVNMMVDVDALLAKTSGFDRSRFPFISREPALDFMKMHAQFVTQLKENPPNLTKNCLLCHDRMDPQSPSKIMGCTSCTQPFHLICLATRLLSKEPDPLRFLIPKFGKCPACSCPMTWSDMVTECRLRSRSSISSTGSLPIQYADTHEAILQETLETSDTDESSLSEEFESMKIIDLTEDVPVLLTITPTKKPPFASRFNFV